MEHGDYTLESVPRAAGPAALLAQPDLTSFLSRAVSWLKWATVAALLVITVAEPTTGRVGLPNWSLLLLFGAYTLVIELLSTRLTWFRSPVHQAMVDLPVATVVYFLGSEQGSLLFVLLVLSVICAAAAMTWQGSLAYTATAIVLTSLAEPALTSWTMSAVSVRDLGGRLVVLALAGTGTALLARRLALEWETARSAKHQTERLEARGRLQEDFISSVSHGLRTPFTAVRAGLGLLEESLSDRMRTDERQLLEEIRHNADRVGMRINDLVALNQLEARALYLQFRRFDMRDVVTETLAVVHPLILDKKQELEVDLPDPLPMEGDPRRLEQVIVNLLDNAHQHTPSGTRISVSGRSQDGELHLAVSDNGPGIAPDEQDAIFQRFHRLDPVEGGWGLGLSVARVIVEMHGGRIWVESRPGKGAAFHIKLPLGSTV